MTNISMKWGDVEMKIRTDFVTNSSSSSYIIGKKDDNITIEDVYQMVRKAFIRYYELGQELKEFMKTYKGPFELVENKWGFDVEYKGRVKVSMARRKKETKAFEKQVPKDLEPYVWCDFPFELEKWVQNCTTYDDFVAAPNNTKIYLTIFDYTNPSNSDWVYTDISKMSQQELDDFTSKHLKDYSYYESTSSAESAVLEWYYDYITEAFQRAKPEKYKGIEVSTLPFEKGSDSSMDAFEKRKMKEQFERVVERIKTEDIPFENACLYLMGKYCIYSEDCYIPYVVAELLNKQALFGCNHMG